MEHIMDQSTNQMDHKNKDKKIMYQTFIFSFSNDTLHYYTRQEFQVLSSKISNIINSSPAQSIFLHLYPKP
jgi:hypothetical protein